MLKRGDKGAQVGYFQRRLRECGQLRESRDLLPSGVDNDFGPETEGAVKTVQGYVGFPRTGIIDMATAIYIQALSHSGTPHGGGTSGITQGQADARYVRRGGKVTVTLP